MWTTYSRCFKYVLSLIFLCAAPTQAQEAQGETLTDEQQIEAVHQGTKIVTGASGVPIAYTGKGASENPGIIFIHSLLTSSMIWDKQINSDLADDFNLAAMDMRGHGSSGKPWTADQYADPAQWAGDIAAVATHAGMKKPVLVAWSFGGLFAMDYIRTYGTKDISGVVLVGSRAGLEEPFFGRNRTLAQRIYYAKNNSPNFSVVFDWAEGYMQNYVESSDPHFEQHHRRLVASSLMTPHYVRPFFRQRSSDNRDLIAKLDIPVTFIVGSEDAMGNVSKIREIAGQIEEASVIEYPDGGQTVFWYMADRFNRDLRTIVQRLSTPN